MTRTLKFTALVALLMAIPLVWKITVRPARPKPPRIPRPGNAADRRYAIDDWTG